MHNDTYSVHKRGLVLWRARLLTSGAFCMSILLHCPMPTVPPFPLLAGRVPQLLRLPRWLPFPRVHAHPLHTVHYSTHNAYIYLGIDELMVYLHLNYPEIISHRPPHSYPFRLFVLLTLLQLAGDIKPLNFEMVYTRQQKTWALGIELLHL